MDTVLHGVTSTLAVDLSESGVTPKAITFRVTDQFGAVVFPETPISGFLEGTLSVFVQIPAETNTLEEGELYGARSVELFVSGDGVVSSVVPVIRTYRVMRKDPLVLLQNSFLSVSGAEAQASMLVNLPGWEVADSAIRVAAMVEAFERICSMNYKLSDTSTGVLAELTPEEWAGLSVEFRTALGKAQVIQANDILTMTEDRSMREAGVISVKVGESTRAFTERPPVQAVICARARSVLSRYLVSRAIRIGRA